MEKGSIDLFTLEGDGQDIAAEDESFGLEEEKAEEMDLAGKALYDKNLFANEVIEDEEVDYD